jgi:hypothetical protein
MYLACTRYVPSTYWYVLGKTKKRLCITFGFEAWIMHSIHCHTTTLRAFNSWCYLWLIQDIYTIRSTLASHGTCWLVSDVGRGSSSAPGSGHDVTGPGINLNFPEAHCSCGTGLRLRDVAMDRRQTEKQAPAGELAGFTALGTHELEACQWPSCCPALLLVCTGRHTGSTCHDCSSDKQESADGPHHCISCQHQFALAAHAL